MDFTGERYIPTEQGRIRLEHYHRYAAVLDVVSGKAVLDVACGEGYGSALMSDVAASVVGVDIAADAVGHALSTYASRDNLTFVQASASALEFEDASFDVIVSFETIEHLAEQAEMLAEFRRVLRPKGALVISSPNRPVYAEETGVPNPFHVRELDFCEFDAALKSQFPAVRFYGQRMMMGSVIQPVDGVEREYRAWHDDGSTIRPQSASFSEPVYFVGVCAAEERMLPIINSSVAYSDQFDLAKQYGELAKNATRLANDIATYHRQADEFEHLLKSTREELGAAYAHIESQRADLTAYQQQAADFDHLLKSSREELQAAYAHIENQTTKLGAYERQAVDFDHLLKTSREELQAAYAHIENQTTKLGAYERQAADFDHLLKSSREELQAYEHQASLFDRAQLELQSLVSSLQNQNNALQYQFEEHLHQRDVELQSPRLLARQFLRALLRRWSRRSN